MNDTKERVVLVDENDQQIGTEDKLAAHQKGMLHRAFSIFVFSRTGDLLLQQRAKGKYHSELLWTNTCCSHPRPEEDILAAAHRRLQEEMGFDCELREKFLFTYKAVLDHGITEYEIDHVFFGTYDGEVKSDPSEAADWKWISLDELARELDDNSAAYTAWLKNCFHKVQAYAQ